MRRRHRKSDCPVHFALEVFGDPWTLLIIRDLMFKDRRTYSDFLRAEEGIATNILAARLSVLQERGFIEQIPDPSDKRRHTYRFTAEGRGLCELLGHIANWGSKHLPGTKIREGIKPPGK